MFEHITASEVAGYAVGSLLLAATISAPRIDSLVSTSQRRSLGMCLRCGDLKLISCSNCRGSGLIIKPFDLVPVVGRKPSSNSPKLPPCNKCGAKGHFPCPSCSEFPQEAA